MLGLLSDSHGDLDAFEIAYELLRQRGAKRFIFLGGRYTDLDDWVFRMKDRARGGRSYSDSDFLTDISNFLKAKTAVQRGPAFGEAPPGEQAPPTDFERLKATFARTPERDCLHYRDPEIAKKAVEMLGDTLCCAVHDKNDLDRDDLLNATVFLHGKESEPKVVQIGPRYFVTPGRLAGAAEQTCGLLELDERSLRYSAFRLDGAVLIDRQLLSVERKTKLSVK
jgi:hypothetical protein